MSLKFAILTSLTERAGSGIELARRFDKSIGYFWPATHQQIYRELDRLGGDGLIRELPRQEPPRRGQPRTFEVTPDGREALERWVREVDEPEPMKSALAVRVRAAAATGTVHEVREAIGHQRRVRAAAVERYLEIERRDFDGDHPGDASRMLQHQILTLGIRVEQAWVSWCDETLAALDRLSPP